MAASPLLVVEPHADDAFLSLGGHIEQWVKEGRRVKILTVFSGTRKRASDAQAYATAVRAEWEGWGYPEGEPLPTDLPLLPVEFQVILPLALTHPEHILVRERLEQMGDWFYLDQPYGSIQKNAATATNLLLSKQVVSFRHPGIRKYRHIPLFKDQAKFYHFNPADKLTRTFELIVK